jgi:cysteine-rich repeat protein
VPTGTTAAPFATYKYPVGGTYTGIFYNSTEKDYFKCDDACRQYKVNLCGDGYQSNGPDNLDGREECDDGNTVSGDGCSSTCKIEYGYECPYWGRLCDKKCGNGVVDPPYEIAAGVWRTEQCDLGDDRAVNPPVSFLTPSADPRPVG